MIVVVMVLVIFVIMIMMMLMLKMLITMRIITIIKTMVTIKVLMTIIFMIAVNVNTIDTTIACYVNRGQNLEEKICRKWGTDAFAFYIKVIRKQTQQ